MFDTLRKFRFRWDKISNEVENSFEIAEKNIKYETVNGLKYFLPRLSKDRYIYSIGIYTILQKFETFVIIFDHLKVKSSHDPHDPSKSLTCTQNRFSCNRINKFLHVYEKQCVYYHNTIIILSLYVLHYYYVYYT